MTADLREGHGSGTRGRPGPRILIVCLAPLEMEFGASQMAMNLSAALRDEGLSVSLWSPYPLPLGLRWFRVVPYMRRALDSFIAGHGPFDVIDAPAVVITRGVARAGTSIARSIQPEIHYQFAGWRRPRALTPREVSRLAAHDAYAVYVTACVLLGWARVDRILCLGSIEYEWMSRWCPWWRHKLGWYVNALRAEDQTALAAIRGGRAERAEPGRRFLWVGRTAGHKGFDRLVSYITSHVKARPMDTFTIAGCGHGAAALLPGELIAAGHVRVIPAYERRALPGLLRDHDVGLFTSGVEGWGLSLNEMLESGMPVYATPVGGVPDLQPYFRGMLRRFPPGPGERFAIGRASAELREYYETFSWSAIARRYVGLLRAARPEAG
jgi:glycosyltransferase involved in cell wall biosynthesis